MSVLPVGWKGFSQKIHMYGYGVIRLFGLVTSEKRISGAYESQGDCLALKVFLGKPGVPARHHAIRHQC
jgi:hypothetical protein